MAFDPGLKIGQILKMQILLTPLSAATWVECVVQDYEHLGYCI